MCVANSFQFLFVFLNFIHGMYLYKMFYIPIMKYISILF